ncbi:type IV pilus assembly protein PilV [Marinobacter sp. LV10R520-4]|uniref:type IV pilus modification protein PilV n=1 Tax=Marinobacter sp. LV10R520-4 TaxID=1761796 RepID=UPI000BF50719|nr:type IV pilus modification protein PilV [Marinobacter sp. LV10R520-4]PFG51775.1 type IV pilus assembly protein PilV [Marinobacter sp. LV10R520-4]
MTQPILVKTERRNRQQLNLKQQSGLGLIEILVAVLVLGIGILGVASTQVVSLQMTSQSQSRSQAVLLAEDMLDRVRANSRNPADYALAAGVAVGADNGACDTSFVPANATVAGNDIEAWENNLACLLPAAQRAIEVAGNTVTITIDWNQKDQAMNSIVVRTEI